MISLIIIAAAIFIFLFVFKIIKNNQAKDIVKDEHQNDEENKENEPNSLEQFNQVQDTTRGINQMLYGQDNQM